MVAKASTSLAVVRNDVGAAVAPSSAVTEE
jgi:hypothetical protein